MNVLIEFWGSIDNFVFSDLDQASDNQLSASKWRKKSKVSNIVAVTLVIKKLVYEPVLA